MKSIRVNWQNMKLPICQGEWVGPKAEFYLPQNNYEIKVQFEKIVLINLKNNNLFSVPIELFQLPNVVEINISENQIRELPSLSILQSSTESSNINDWACPNLKVLQISSNLITQIPESVWNIPSLYQLISSNNSLENYNLYVSIY